MWGFRNKIFQAYLRPQYHRYLKMGIMTVEYFLYLKQSEKFAFKSAKCRYSELRFT